MEVPILISRPAPTALAVEQAARWGLTLAGYARRDRCNVKLTGGGWPHSPARTR